MKPRLATIAYSLGMLLGLYFGLFCLIKWQRPAFLATNEPLHAVYTAAFYPLRSILAEDSVPLARSAKNPRVIFLGCNSGGDKIFVRCEGTDYALYAASDSVAALALQRKEHERITLVLEWNLQTDDTFLDYYCPTISRIIAEEGPR